MDPGMSVIALLASLEQVPAAELRPEEEMTSLETWRSSLNLEWAFEPLRASQVLRLA